ncbi:MAG: hypothetical protein P1U56_23785 [Saprospiraceae bacterium]|nr:hypothetical protein [Saprospiraceae bacterium]
MSSRLPLKLNQLLIKSNYKWKYIGRHTVEDESRKQINAIYSDKKFVVADRNIILGGKEFAKGNLVFSSSIK